MQRKSDAKTKFIETASRQFSARGFEAVSLSDIASELGLTKQSIVYHFKTKEALYGEVLAATTRRYEALMDQVDNQAIPPSEKWGKFLSLLWDHGRASPADARLVTHELLGNAERAKAGRKWYMREFLDRCVAFFAATDAGAAMPLAERRAHIYQQIGALNYLKISEVTLTAIWGADAVADMNSDYLKALLKR